MSEATTEPEPELPAAAESLSAEPLSAPATVVKVDGEPLPTPEPPAPLEPAILTTQDSSVSVVSTADSETSTEPGARRAHGYLSRLWLPVPPTTASNHLCSSSRTLWPAC